MVDWVVGGEEKTIYTNSRSTAPGGFTGINNIEKAWRPMPPTSLIVWGGSSEVVPKFTPHRPRIGWKTIPNGPECSRHPPRRVSKWFRDHFGAQIDAFTCLKQKKEGPSHWICLFSAHFRQPAGTRKSTKIAPVPKKASPKTASDAIFVPAPLFLAFPLQFKPKM